MGSLSGYSKHICVLKKINLIFYCGDSRILLDRFRVI
jgi:hypothetical protein